MVSQKHTPGPWQRNIPPASHYPTIFAGRSMHVARVVPTRSGDETEANANLIAAAPDLLESLKAAMHALRSYQYGNAAPDLAESAADHAEATIAKATGQEGTL